MTVSPTTGILAAGGSGVATATCKEPSIADQGTPSTVNERRK